MDASPPAERGDGPPARADAGPLTTAFSDLDLRRWKQHDDIITDSLWLLGARAKDGPHRGDYWGNFVPQIPNQILRRFTKRGETVVDLFAGMGTTLIECCHLGRHGVGVELSPATAALARERIARAANSDGVCVDLLVGDSRSETTADLVRERLARLGQRHAACVLLHPPYHDIIRFSDDPADLSTLPSVDAFLAQFGRVVDRAVELLAPDRFLALVIGDTYSAGAVVPLGFRCMALCQERGLVLKGINVKDIQGNERGKGRSTNLWRYRALRQGFFIFKHEYIFVFRKPKA